MSYKNRLEALKKNWETDKAAVGSGQLPGGKYQFQIKRALISESKARNAIGHMQVELHLVVITGQMKGRKHIYRQDLEAKANVEKGWPSGISRFKGILETLEVDMPRSLDQKGLDKTLSELVNIVFNGTCVVNEKGYSNVYINDLVKAPADDGDDDTETTIDDDEPASEIEEEQTEDTEEETTSDDDTEEPQEEEPKPAKKPVGKPAPSKPTPKPVGKKPAPKEEEEGDDWEKEFDKK